MIEDIFDSEPGGDLYGGYNSELPTEPASLPDIPQDTPSATDGATFDDLVSI